MLYHLSLFLRSYYTAFNVVHYVSFRSVAALLTTFFISLLCGDKFITTSKLLFTSKVRESTPEHHAQKNGRPTMGGLLILFTVLTNALLWCNWCEQRVWIFLFCTLGFGAIGLYDDVQKIRCDRGMSARSKFFWQIAVATMVVMWWVVGADASTSIALPFFKNIYLDIGWLFCVWAVFIIVGASNAVNLTDGLDGLAIGSLLPNFILFSLICFVASNCGFAHYLHIPYAPSGEIAVLGGILIGASLGFLWYNAYPAEIFMGDIGSLSLGSSLALMALMSKQELLLPLSGGLFVVETLSVMAQVVSYRLWGRRLFKMAPIHHHFELMGWPESKVTMRFGIISIVCCLLALMTLKIR